MTSPRPTVLIVDDEDVNRQLLARCLLEWGFDALQAADGEAALEVMADHAVNMVVSDVRMPGMDGLELFSAIRRKHPVLPVLLITAFPDIRQAVEAVKDGALDYLSKPIDLEELRDLVSASLGLRTAEPDAVPPVPEGVIHASKQMQSVLREAHLVADSDASVLITGESGVGKEVIADLIHGWSRRSRRDMVKINCAGIPENLVESELFGHKKGAFTGALHAREGHWAKADGSSLMLDEVGELPLPLQAKLLRALQDGSFAPLGSDETRYADVRVIAATNRNLEEEVAKGRFREDLYYRLNVVELHLPPLCRRPEDIMPIVRHFATRFLGQTARISPEAQRLFLAHNWPGNIRELGNCVERACLMARGGVLMPEHFPQRILRQVAQSSSGRPQQLSQPSTLAESERRHILATLAECKGNRTRAATVLGISRRALVYKLKSYA